VYFYLVKSLGNNSNARLATVVGISAHFASTRFSYTASAFRPAGLAFQATTVWIWGIAQNKHASTLISADMAVVLTLKVYYFKEPLFHFRSLKKSTKDLLFFLLVLLWYFLVFELLWCRHTMYRGVCQDPTYIEVRLITDSPLVQSSCLLFQPAPAPWQHQAR
jgi:hypothetical protein